MDWSKAKNILIIALILTNCMLGGLYYHQYSQKNLTQREDMEYVVKQLEYHNIFVDTEIPDKMPKMPILYVTYDGQSEEEIQEILDDQPGMEETQADETELRHYCEDILKQCGFQKDSLTYLNAEKEKTVDVLHYKNIYEGIPLEESGIEVYLENGRVTSIERRWLEPVNYGKTRQKVISAAEALIQFMLARVDTNNPEETDGIIRISDISMVYWVNPALSSEGSVEDTAVPAWRITYNGGQTSFIEGYRQDQE